MRISVPVSGFGGRRGAALLLLERERAVAGNECRNQRQRYNEPGLHLNNPARSSWCVRPEAKMLPRSYHDKDVLGTVKP